jgi:methionyl-tRNA formyltransferase
MPKIVCLIRHEPPLIYFVNKINQTHGPIVAIVEHPEEEKSLWERIRLKGATGTFHAIIQRFKQARIKKEQHRIYTQYFGENWKAIEPGIETLNVNNINLPEVADFLARIKPDLILDHGTSLVKDHILNQAPLALNLHWGLSPYYRGTFCTEWALVNWDPYNIGVTIHKLTNIIDGGSILAQRRADIKAADTAHSINMQLTYLGTDLACMAIDKIANGKELEFHKQDISRGFMTRYSQFSELLRMQVEFIEKRGLLKLMLEKPARKHRLPIIEF